MLNKFVLLTIAAFKSPQAGRWAGRRYVLSLMIVVESNAYGVEILAKVLDIRVG